MAELFGFEFKRKNIEPELKSFTPAKTQDDGAVEVSAGGAYGTYVDLDGVVRSEAWLVQVLVKGERFTTGGGTSESVTVCVEVQPALSVTVTE